MNQKIKSIGDTFTVVCVKQSFVKRGGKCWKRTPSRKDYMEHAERYSECEGVIEKHSPMGRVLKRKTDKLIEKCVNFAK